MPSTPNTPNEVRAAPNSPRPPGAPRVFPCPPSSPTHPQRIQLPHDVPIWIDPSAETYFITICCEQRNANTLCHDHLAQNIFGSVAFRHERRDWFCHLFLLMPDHLHALLSFVNRSKTIQQIVGDWKRWLAVKRGIQWQTNFFEHRIRDEQAGTEKFQYILNNPVRKGLVERWEDWKYVWRPSRVPDHGVPGGHALPS
jgi:putative transposase